MHRSWSLSLAVALASAVLAAAEPTFTSTWKWMDARSVSFAGQKVAALVISQDEPLRISGEEALVRELSARGLDMVATYRIVPRPELETADKARAWYEKAGVEGVVALRPVSRENVRSYSQAVWVSPSYSTLWSYYGYGWAGMYVPGPSRKETVIVVEALVFSVPLNQLLWAGVSETRNPEQLQQFVKDLVVSAGREMQKQGLLEKGPR